MGSSRDIAIGPVAVVSLLLGILLQNEVDPSNNPAEYMRLAFTATFFAGITQATLGFLRLGFLIDFLSHAAIVGFMGGSAITIALQQLKGFLGIKKFTKKSDIVSVMHSVCGSVHHGWNWQTILIASVFLAFLLFSKYIGKKRRNLFWVPAIAPLISVIVSTFFVYITRADKHGVQIVNDIKKVDRTRSSARVFSRPDMSGRKRRDRPQTMDELLRRAQASTSSGDPRPTSGATQSGSMASSISPSTSHPVRTTAAASSSRPAPDDAQTGTTSTGPSTNRGRGPARGVDAKEISRYTHNWWHVAVCYLEGCSPLDKVLEVYDCHIWNELQRSDADCGEVYLNALGLLLRVYVRGQRGFIENRLKILATCLMNELAEALYEYGRENYERAFELLGPDFDAHDFKMVGASDEQLDVFNEVWYSILLNTRRLSKAIEVIEKQIKKREGAPFLWQLLERAYSIAGRDDASVAAERAKALERAYFEQMI